MSRYRIFIVLAVVVCMGFAADASEAALAKAAGGSGFSGKLSKNKAIRKQQLICDPESPTAGSTSVSYDPSVVTLSGLEFGPGYFGSGQVEIYSDETFLLVDIDDWLAEKFGQETGYVQVQYSEPMVIDSEATIQEIGGFDHGKIPVPTSYLTIDTDGPESVDTHAFLFDYLANVSDDAIAKYTIYADAGNRPSGNEEDYLEGYDDEGNFFRVWSEGITSASVRGSLNTIPLPAAVWMGGATMIGAYFAARRRRNAA